MILGSHGLPLGHPVVTLCHGDPVALDLQGWSLHILQQITDGVDIEVGYDPGSGPGWLQGWSACQVSSVLTARVSSPALPPASSHLAAMSKGQGQFSCFYAFLVGSLEPGPSVYLSCSAQVRCRVHSTKCCSGWGSGTVLLLSGTSLPPATSSMGLGGGEASLPCSHHHMAGPNFSCSCSWSGSSLGVNTVNRVSSVLPRGVAGPSFLSAEGGEGESQLAHPPHMTGAVVGKSAFLSPL